MSRFMLRLYHCLKAALKVFGEKQYSALPRIEDMAAEHVAIIKKPPNERPRATGGPLFCGECWRLRWLISCRPQT